MVRKGLRLTLQARPDWQIVGEAVSGRDAVEKAIGLTPDVVVMDVSMPELSGLEATRRIKEEVPGAQVLILTMHNTQRVVEQVLQAGANGYLLKSDSSRELVQAIDSLLHGKPYFTTPVARMIVEGFLRAHGSAAEDPLSPREREILQLVAEGGSTKEIAQRLEISVKTAETHRTNLMRKIGAHSVADVVRYAVRNGIIVP